MGKEMDSKDEASVFDGNSDAGSDGDTGSNSGVAGIALAASPAHCSFFTNGDSHANNEDYGPSYCFMTKASKVSSKKPTFDSSDDDLLSKELDDMKPSYSKLASIATKQQKSLVKQQKTVDK